jgi:release factor glutamine methyltransferase
VTGREAVREVAASLGRAGVDSPQVDAELLVAHALGVTRSALYADDLELTADEDTRLRSYLERRAAREPAAYILGEWGFRRLNLLVDARVLVPRPETEIVVERCLVHLGDLAEPRVLDVGTGSGAIALAIADEHPGAHVVGTDISDGALALAAENRARAGLDERVELVQGHLSARVPGPFDLVVSNPPYVRPEDFDGLPPEIRLYEPREAVVGVGAHAAVTRRARDLLVPGGLLVFECGDDQAAEVRETLSRRGFVGIAAFPDLTGRERVVEGRRPRS